MKSRNKNGVANDEGTFHGSVHKGGQGVVNKNNNAKTAITNISNFLKVFRGTYTLTESGQADDAYFPAASFDSIVTTLSFSDEAASLSSLVSL